MTAYEKMTKIVAALSSKKALDIKAIEISGLTVIADYFVIASGTSTTHTKGLADEVEFKLEQDGIRPDHIEGFDGAQWIAMDYNDVVVHLFYKDTADLYKLEKLWSDGKSVDISALL